MTERSCSFPWLLQPLPARDRQASCHVPIFQVRHFPAAQPLRWQQWCNSWRRSETRSGRSDLSAVSMASLMHHLCAGYYTLNRERESERVGEIYLFVLKERRGGFMSYQQGRIFSAWWIMVRYLLILWKEAWRQSVTSFLSDCGYTRQPSSFTALLPDATDVDEIWQREAFVLNLAQKHTG